MWRGTLVATPDTPRASVIGQVRATMIDYGTSEREDRDMTEVQAAVIETLAFGMTAITRQNIADEEGKTLPGLQKAVGGYVDVLTLTHPTTGSKADMWVNDEGKFNGSPLNEFATILAIVCESGIAHGDYITGTVVLAGFNEEGETTALSDDWMELITSIA